jgi:lipid-A-disaccharide synthase-like uncharacterized protein
MSETERVSRPSLRLPFGVAALGCAPLVVAYFFNLWDQPYYRFFPLALLGAGWLAWRGWRSAPPSPMPGARWLVLTLTGTALALLATGAVLWVPWLGVAALLCVLLGAVWARGGGRLAGRLLPALVMGLTVLTPPFGWDEAVMNRLEGWVMSGAGRMLYSMQVPHLLGWLSVELAGRKIPLKELFAGLNLLPGLLAVCLFYLLWRRRPVVLVGLTLAAVFAFAMPGEVVRVAFGLRACDTLGVDRFANWRNAVTAWGMCGLGLGLMLSVDQLLVFLTDMSQMRQWGIRSTASEAPATAAEPGPPGARAALSPPLAWGLVGVSALLGLTQLGTGWNYHRHQVVAEGPPTAGTLAEVRFELPDAWGEWKRAEGTNSMSAMALTPGAKSQRWYYQKGELSLVLAVDYPWRGFASPVLAYREADWRVAAENLSGTEPGAVLPSGRAELALDPVLKGVLWYGAVTAQGQWLLPAAPPSERPLAYRVQGLLLVGRKIEPSDIKEAKDVFEQARTQWSRQLAELPRKNQP